MAEAIDAIRPDLRAAFAGELRRALGLGFSPGREHLLDQGAARAAAAIGESPEALLLLIERGDPAALSALADEITVHETYFFRHSHHFDLLREAIRELWRARRSDEPLRCWSAGCASGEEAYSMAIAALEVIGPEAREGVEILATDVSPLALERTRRATYGEWSFRGVSPAVRDRWFEPAGHLLRVIDAPRSMVSAMPLNLIEEVPIAPVPWPRGVHVIFCRNVLIYLDAAAVARVGASLARALAPEGLLIPGPSDPLLRSPLLTSRVRATAVCYERTREARPAIPAPAPVPAPPPLRPPPAPIPAARPRPAPAPPPEDPPRDEGPIARARRLADHGASAEAIGVLDAAIAEDPLLKEAYALRGVVRQAIGDAAGAAMDAGRAILIDRGFAFAHLLAATAYLKLGERAGAGVHLRNARRLLGELAPDTAVEGAGGATAAALLDTSARLARTLQDPPAQGAAPARIRR